MKRHESLVPLSHDHHLGLLLAQRIKHGKAKAPASSWPEDRGEQRNRAVDFFDTELIFHLQAEERFVFPLAERYLPADLEILTLLRKQHTQLRELIQKLRGASGIQLENLLLRFGHVLEDHIRKEERIFFERIQRDVPEEELETCGRQIEQYYQSAHKSGSDRCVS